MTQPDFLDKTIFDYTDDPKIIQDVVGYPVSERDYMEDLKTSQPDVPIADISDYAHLVGNKDLYDAAHKYLQEHWPDVYAGITEI